MGEPVERPGLPGWIPWLGLALGLGLGLGGLALAPLDELLLRNLRVQLLATLGTGALLLIAWPLSASRPASPPPRLRWRQAGAALALVLGVALGHFALRVDARSFPPVDASDWSPWLLLCVAAPLALLDSARPWPTPLRHLLRFPPCAALAWLILRPVLQPYGSEHYGSWLPLQDTALYGALGAGALVYLLVQAVDRAAPAAPPQDRWSAAATPAGLTLLAGGGAAAVGLSGSESLALQAGLLAGALSLVTLRALLAPAPLLGGGASLVIGLALAAPWLSARTYAQLPPACAALLLLAPLGLLLQRAPGLRRASPRLAAAAAVIQVALVTGLAVGLALHASPSFATVLGTPTSEGGESADDDPYGGYGDYGGY